MPEVLERATALQEARQLYARHSWSSAFEALRRLDEQEALAAPDLEQLAWSAALVGQEETYLQVLERLYHLHLDGETRLVAARCAFWLGFRLMLLGEVARGAAWVGRSQQQDRRGVTGGGDGVCLRARPDLTADAPAWVELPTPKNALSTKHPRCGAPPSHVG